MKPPLLLIMVASAILHFSSFGRTHRMSRGYMGKFEKISLDSIVDFSDVARYGSEVEWHRYVLSDSAIIETYGDRWVRFHVVGDNILLEHKENDRERTDLNNVCLFVDSCAVSQNFNAISRRDMSFVYADSGKMNVRRFMTPVLVLATGDTVINCRGEERVFEYKRMDYESLRNLGVIRDTELLWYHESGGLPLAIAADRFIHNDKFDGIVESVAWCFPREHNDLKPETIDKEESVKKDVSRQVSTVSIYSEPKIVFDGSLLKISSYVNFKYLICDTSGRIISSGFSPKENQITTDLTDLPRGGYVVAVFWEGGKTSQTIILE